MVELRFLGYELLDDLCKQLKEAVDRASQHFQDQLAVLGSRQLPRRNGIPVQLSHRNIE